MRRKGATTSCRNNGQDMPSAGVLRAFEGLNARGTDRRPTGASHAASTALGQGRGWRTQAPCVPLAITARHPAPLARGHPRLHLAPRVPDAVAELVVQRTRTRLLPAFQRASGEPEEGSHVQPAQELVGIHVRHGVTRRRPGRPDPAGTPRRRSLRTATSRRTRLRTRDDVRPAIPCRSGYPDGGQDPERPGRLAAPSEAGVRRMPFSRLHGRPARRSRPSAA